MERLFKYTLTTILFFSHFSAALHAKIYIADASKKLPVGEAIKNALDGDTVLIRKGTYREGPLIVKNAISIIGEGQPVLDGEDKHEILLIESDDVMISGIVFKNSGSSSFMDIAALKIQNSKNVIVKHNRFENNFFGIHCMNSSFCYFENNYLKSGETKGKPSANGIHCWKSNNLSLKENTVTGHRDGIYFEFVTHSVIENNKSIKNKRYGLHFMFSHDDVYNHNEIRGNGAGVAVMYSKRVKMLHNTFADNWGNAAYGLLLKEISDSHIESNIFESNTIAIFAEGSNRVPIIKNQFLKNGWALRIHSSCSGINVTENNFIGNTFDVSTNGNLATNRFSGNFWDKYDGYDLNRDNVGDVPHQPVTFYSVITERNPGALMLFRSFFVNMMDKAEKAFPALTPESLDDDTPAMKKLQL